MPTIKADHDRVTIAQGATFPHREILKAWGFCWHPDLELWWTEPMKQNEITRLSREIGDMDVDIRYMRRNFL